MEKVIANKIINLAVVVNFAMPCTYERGIYMKLQRQAIAGSLESSDCLVMVKPADELRVDLDSIVIERYGQQIRRVIMEAIAEMGIRKGYFRIQDKGALDYCIKARVRTAIKRAGDRNVG